MVLWVVWADGDCPVEAAAANGLPFRPERLTCRGRRALPVNEGNIPAVKVVEDS